MSVISRMRSFDDNIDFRKVWQLRHHHLAVRAAHQHLGHPRPRPNLGLDFEGGTSWDVPTSSLSVDDARDALAHGRGRGEDPGHRPGDSRVLRVQSIADDVDDAGGGVRGPRRRRRHRGRPTSASPPWARRGAIRSPRRPRRPSSGSSSPSRSTSPGGSSGRWRSARWLGDPRHHHLGGFYAVFGIEVTPATVIAFLTILGFSLYDTIVVFDRMQENVGPPDRDRPVHLHRHREPLAQPGADALGEHHDHGPAPGPGHAHRRLLRDGRGRPAGVRARPAVGLVIGAFSSIFVASPLVAWIKEREPRNRGASGPA